jgi:hypothetical protein
LPITKFIQFNDFSKGEQSRSLIMKKRTLIIAGMISAFIYSLSSCGGSSPEERVVKGKTATQDTSVQRGAYLVTVIGCNDCHSPRVMGVWDPERLLSGYPSNVPVKSHDLKDLEPGSAITDPTGTAFTGPWGTTFAANLTSDGTGVGNWSLKQFKNALTRGKHKGIDEERNLLPPMPWQNYSDMEEDDLKAIFAYLKSTKPVSNIVHDAIPAGKMK